MNEDEVKTIMSQLLHIVNTFHDLGIYNRNINPSTILIDLENLDVYISDFGVSCNVFKNSHNLESQLNVLVGSPGFIDPYIIKTLISTATPISTMSNN